MSQPVTERSPAASMQPANICIETYRCQSASRRLMKHIVSKNSDMVFRLSPEFITVSEPSHLIGLVYACTSQLPATMSVAPSGRAIPTRASLGVSHMAEAVLQHQRFRLVGNSVFCSVLAVPPPFWASVIIGGVGDLNTELPYFFCICCSGNPS